MTQVTTTGNMNTNGKKGQMETARVYGMEDIDMTDNETQKNTDNGGHKWDQPKKGPDDKLPAEERVKNWEEEIEKLEKEVARAATETYKIHTEKKLHEAQCMLKESLLRLTVEQDDESEDEAPQATLESEANMDVDKDKEIDLTNDKESEDEGKDDMITEAGRQTLNATGTNETVFDSRRGIDTFKWGDDSDDETVVFQNQNSSGTDKDWQTVKNKNRIKETNKKSNNIINPYSTKNKKIEQKVNKSEQKNENNNKSSLASFLEITKGKLRNKNSHSVRINMSFTPRTAGSGEYIRIAKELLVYGGEIDPNIMLLPWEESTETGPININDLANPRNVSNSIKKFFHKPAYINWQSGSPVYGIGVQFSTNLGKYEFMDRWNLKKQEYKQTNRVAYSISMAPMQNSPSAYIIGIAVGSSEKQDSELLNQRLGNDVGIEGIEVSFQNVHQVGITQEFWKLANDKAMAINTDKYTRDHLREKYRWAPNALAIYVPRKDLVSTARKAMITKYGKSIEGNDPIWPDGSSMRFLPIKGPMIKNDKTRSIVRKRMAFHIWMKANEITIDTNMIKIHQSMEAFNGNSFAEIVLSSTDENNQRVFSHFNRAWSNNPGKERWALSVKPQMNESASKVFNNLKDDLYDKYGPDINNFFQDTRTATTWSEAVRSKYSPQEDEDDWFDDDDDIDEVVNKGFIDSTFLRFFDTTDNKDEDKQSVASWGTGNTAYTEIVTTQVTNNTVDSSITHDTPLISDDEIDTKKSIVRVRLMIKGLKEEEIDNILGNKSPYELAFSGIHLPTWDPDKEVFMLLAIRKQYIEVDKSKTIEQNDDSDSN